MENSGSSTKQLKQVLGFGDLMSTAVGQIIGSGIMTLLGAAIALTGRSTPFALIISALIVIGYSIPFVMICGVVRVRGGNYTMISMLAGKRITGIFVIMYILQNFCIPMYGLSIASYLISLMGFGNEKLIAIIAMTVFFVLNIFGVDKMAKFQGFIVICMCVALGLFVAFGVGHIQPDYFENGFLTGGVGGLFEAAGLLTFATGGGAMIANLSCEAKNPTRDIPLVIILSTLLVSALYAVVAFVAAGVLPVEQVADQNLSMVAQVIFNKPMYLFFMIFGALFAIISTMNAEYAWVPKPILQMCDDGWLPKKLAYVHPKYGTPIVIQTLLYGGSVLCVVAGLDIGTLGNIALVYGSLSYMILSAFMWKLPALAPKGWANSKFKVGKGMMAFLIIISTLANLFNTYLNAIQLSTPLLIGAVVLLVVAVVYAELRMKHATVEPSFEEIQG